MQSVRGWVGGAGGGGARPAYSILICRSHANYDNTKQRSAVNCYGTVVVLDCVKVHHAV